MRSPERYYQSKKENTSIPRSLGAMDHIDTKPSNSSRVQSPRPAMSFEEFRNQNPVSTVETPEFDLGSISGLSGMPQPNIEPMPAPTSMLQGLGNLEPPARASPTWKDKLKVVGVFGAITALTVGAYSMLNVEEEDE